MISVQTILKGVHDAISFSELCRLCGCLKSPSISIFDESYRTSYHDIINFHFQDIQVSKTDTLPLKLCSDCANFVISWHCFYNSCVEVNQALSSVTDKFKFEPNTPQSNQPESKIDFDVIELHTEDVSPDLEKNILVYEDKFCSKLAESNVECVTGHYVFVDTDADVIEKDVSTVPTAEPKASSSPLVPPSVDKGLGGAAGTTKCKGCGSVFLKSKIQSSQNRGMCYACYSKAEKSIPVSEAFKNYLVTDENKQSYFVCDLCEFSCDACPDVFSHHYKTEHPGADLYQFSRRSKDPLKKFSKLVKGVRAYRCDRCPMSCISRNVFVKHYLEHSVKLAQTDKSLEIEMKNGKFCCPMCLKAFSTEVAAKGHMQRIHGPKQFRCGVCLKAFRYEYQAREHEHLHKKGKTLMCDQCGKKFVHFGNLKTHMSNHSQLKYSCGWCDARFKDKVTLNNHFFECAKKQIKATEDEVKIQPESSHQSDQKINLVKVETTIQPEQSLQLDQQDTNADVPKIQIKFVPQTDASVQEPINYECAKCNEKFDSKMSLRTHIVQEFNLTPYECYICDRPFSTTVLLKKHFRSCNKIIERNTFGTDFSLVVNNGDLFGCKLCGKKCRKKGYLRQHFRTHLNHKPFVCQFCGKSYVFRASFRAHMLSEINLRTYICSDCGKRYNTSSHLTAHIKKHHRLRQFKCNLCDKEFAYERDLNEHEKTHDPIKMFCCEKCGGLFKTVRYLRVHLDICTGVRNK